MFLCVRTCVTLEISTFGVVSCIHLVTRGNGVSVHVHQTKRRTGDTATARLSGTSASSTGGGQWTRNRAVNTRLGICGLAWQRCWVRMVVHSRGTCPGSCPSFPSTVTFVTPPGSACVRTRDPSDSSYAKIALFTCSCCLILSVILLRLLSISRSVT